MPVARVTNLGRTIEELKEKGLWIVCADPEGEDPETMELTGPVVLVIGNEGRGVSRLIREKGDFWARIPMREGVGSFNASVACGILCYEIGRQRRKAGEWKL